MKVKALALAGAAVSLFIAGGASADFTGASLELTQDDGPGGMWTWRVYADFDSPTDVLLAIGGIPDLGAVEFSAEGDLFNAAGAFEGLKAGDFPNSPIGDARDSWVTLGFDAFGAGDIDYSPEFSGVPTSQQAIQGSSWSEGNGGWFDPDPGTAVTGEHILIAQFTLDSGTNFTLSGLANWQPGEPEGFESSAFSVTTIPAPATLALLGIAGLVGRRRRG